jgi:hypothetical protein
MASAGLPIIFVGSVPTQAYPTDSLRQSALAAATKSLLSLVNVHQIGSTNQLPSLLSELGIQPRVALTSTSSSVYSVYRSSAEVDYIYLFNDQAIPINCTCNITTSGRVPYIYDAWTGSQTPLLQYEATNTGISIPLGFKSNETTIIALHRSTLPPKCIFPSTSGALHSLTSTSNVTHALITGLATLESSAGKIYTFNPTLPAPTNLTSWDLVIEDWHSASDRFAVQTEITNHTFTNISLVPWTLISDSLTHVSGIGHYTTRFTVPVPTSNSSGLVGILSFPLIQHTARAYLNATLLPPIDPVNPVVLLEGLKSDKTYELSIEVSTTLFNRVKYERDEIMVVGQVAGVRQPLYKSMPYESYGLVGTAMLSWAERVTVHC